MKKITQKEKDAKKLVGLVLSDEAIKSLLTNITQAKFSNIPYSGEAMDVVSKILELVFSEDSLNTFRERMVSIYLKYYNGKDISNMLKFYASATGRKVAKSLPMASVDIANAGQEWTSEVFNNSAAKIETIIDEAFKSKLSHDSL